MRIIPRFIYIYMMEKNEVDILKNHGNFTDDFIKIINSNNR